MSFQFSRFNDRNLRKAVKEEGAKNISKKMVELMKLGEIKEEDLSIRALYDNFNTTKNNDKEPAGEYLISSFTEDAASVVDQSSFTTVAGQFFFNAYTQGFEQEDFAITKLAKVVNTTIQDGEKLGGVSNIIKPIPHIAFGQESPSVSPTEDYQQTPPLAHRPIIVDITRPLIEADRTGQIGDMARRTGESQGFNLELNLISAMTDLGVAGGIFDNTQYRYNWKGTKYATYQASASSPNNWVNLITSNGLLDWTQVNNAFVDLEEQPDPYTNTPIRTGGTKYLIVSPNLALTAMRIKHSLMFRTTPAVTDYSPALSAEAGTEQRLIDITPVSSKYLNYYNTNFTGNVGLNTDWYLMANDCLRIMRMFDSEMTEALPNSGINFRNNIAWSIKCASNHVGMMYDPRRVIRNTA